MKKAAYEVRISVWSSEVCSSALTHPCPPGARPCRRSHISIAHSGCHPGQASVSEREPGAMAGPGSWPQPAFLRATSLCLGKLDPDGRSGANCGAWRTTSIVLPAGPMARSTRSEEQTSELKSLMRSSYAVFCLKKKKLVNEDRTCYVRQH